MNIQFQYKEFIWLFIALAVIAILYFALLLWKGKVKKRIGDKKLVLALIDNYSPRLFAFKYFLLFLSLALGIVAVMNPNKPSSSDNIKRKGIDIAIALDVSKSMLAADLQPNRLERAKQFIVKLMNEMPDDRFALVLFAGKAYLQMPLTIDLGAAKMYVLSAQPDAIQQQGTVISDALKMSAAAFNSTERKYKVVVLISDGEEHDVAAVETAKELAKEAVLINTVGIGSPEGALIPDIATGGYKKDAAGNVVVSKLNEETMKQIAQQTNGTYIHLQSSDEAIVALKKQLATIDRVAFGDVSKMNVTTYYMWFVGAMLLLLIIELFISEKRKMAKANKIVTI